MQISHEILLLGLVPNLGKVHQQIGPHLDYKHHSKLSGLGG